MVYLTYESGTRIPDTQTLEKTAEYFGVTTDYLLGKSDDGNNLFSDNMFIEIKRLIDRYISIYENHDIKLTQIPLYTDPIHKLDLSDIKNYDTILQIINDELLQGVSETFSIEKNWIYGVVSNIYLRRDYYKRIEWFMDFILKIKFTIDNQPEVYFLKTKELKASEERNQDVIMVVKYSKLINGKSIFCYIPICTHWDWGYWRSRYQAKSIIKICERLRIEMHGYDISEEEARRITSLTVFPQSIIDTIRTGYTWYPEDYIAPEDHIAKEKDERSQVMNYIKEQKYFETLDRKIKDIREKLINTNDEMEE